ncbi:hypothetical protein FQA39_LY02572 [Lamprigera yunnana]|nr:hypothetical protein FQA39_LY02572 [Lamprigera yunnana]
MSTASKLSLFTASVTSLSIIGYVHYKQELDRSKLHEGVIKDVERQQRRKAENIYVMQQQMELTKQLKHADLDYLEKN